MKKKFSIFNFQFSINGFTLIELLVVVALAAFILSIVFVSLREARARGRDARREEDIKQIQNALDIYNINRRQFPVCALSVINGSADCVSQTLLADNAVNAVAIDPLHGGVGVCLAEKSFIYCYESDGSSYTLHYNLETNTIPGKSAGWRQVKP